MISYYKYMPIKIKSQGFEKSFLKKFKKACPFGQALISVLRIIQIVQELQKAL